MKRHVWHFGRAAPLSALVMAAVLSLATQTAPAQQKVKAAGFASPTAGKDDEGCLAISTELVSFTVTVTDKEGRHVEGLDRGAFAVYEDDVRQEIGFFSDRDAPASIAVVLDVSGSMRGEKIARAREAVARFVRTSHPEDEYSLISFNGSAELLLEGTNDIEALLARFGRISPQGYTALYDGVALGLKALAHGRYSRRALIVISDGEDNRSRSTFDSVRRMLQESGVTVYTILIGPLLQHSSGGAVMDELATASGGKSFFPGDGEAMSESFERIALELRRQYSLGYTPTNVSADGRWHHIKVIVTPPAGLPRLSVRNRKGYYAVAGPANRHGPANGEEIGDQRDN